MSARGRALPNKPKNGKASRAHDFAHVGKVFDRERTTEQDVVNRLDDEVRGLEPIGNALPDIALRLELQEGLRIHREALQDFVRITETPHESWGVQEVKRLDECRRIAKGELP